MRDKTCLYCTVYDNVSTSLPDFSTVTELLVAASTGVITIEY